jgi:hypothetical protein
MTPPVFVLTDPRVRLPEAALAYETHIMPCELPGWCFSPEKLVLAKERPVGERGAPMRDRRARPHMPACGIDGGGERPFRCRRAPGDERRLARSDLLYVHANGIGLPKTITDATQFVVWDRRAVLWRSEQR